MLLSDFLYHLVRGGSQSLPNNHYFKRIYTVVYRIYVTTESCVGAEKNALKQGEEFPGGCFWP